MALLDENDEDLEMLRRRAEQRFRLSNLQENDSPESNLGLQIAAGGLDLIGKNAQASQDIASMMTGVKSPNQQAPSATDALQRAIQSKATARRQRALDDRESMAAIQKLVDAKRAESEKADLLARQGKERRQELTMKGYQEGEDGSLSMIKGGSAELANRKLLSEIGSSGSNRDLERKIKEAQLAKIQSELTSGDGDTGRLNTLVPGVGQALTKEDAKNLKDASVMKSKLDRQLQEMIDLRQNKGAEFFDRASVARGQQLSKDILLTYKNLQKLGVLSKSDEDIINAIIPSDPLQMTISSSTGIGEDPILSNLQKFKADNQKDYEANVATRLRPGGGIQRPVVEDSPLNEQEKSRLQELRAKYRGVNLGQK